MDVSTGAETFERTRAATCFDDLFASCAELDQAVPTRRHVRDQAVVSVARLDRLYTTMNAAELDDRFPSTATWGLATDLKTPSDHIPVHAHLRPPITSLPARFPSIPTWIAKNADFTELFHAECLDVGVTGFPDCFDRLEYAAAAAHSACIRFKIASADVHSDEGHLHHLLGALRASRTGNLRRV